MFRCSLGLYTSTIIKYLNIHQISGERLQGHWSSVVVFCFVLFFVVFFSLYFFLFCVVVFVLLFLLADTQTPQPYMVVCLIIIISNNLLCNAVFQHFKSYFA